MTNSEKIKELQSYVSLLETDALKRLMNLPSMSKIYDKQYQIETKRISVLQGLVKEFKADIKRLEKLDPDEEHTTKQN
jgi:Tfp pilus assembly protein PilP